MLSLLVANCRLTIIGESYKAERLLCLLDGQLVCTSCFIQVQEMLSQQC